MIFASIVENKKHDQFSHSERCLPINRNHKSATQQQVSLRAVVTHAQGLMLTVAKEVVQ